MIEPTGMTEPGGTPVSPTHDDHPSGWNRLIAVGAIVVLLAVPALAVAVLAHAPSDGAAALARRVAVEMPGESPSHATSSSWYCAGPRSIDGTVPGTLDFAGRNHRAVTGDVSWVNETDSDVASTAVPVPAESQVAVATPLTSGEYEAAAATFPAGRISAWEAASGPGGESVYPCASYTSQQWYFAGGDADAGDRLVYLLYNPASTTAVADMSFATATGPVVDTAYQGIIVPAGRLVVEDLSSRLYDTGSVAASVNCRLGQIVAFQVELRPPSPASATGAQPPAGTGAVSVSLGAPSTGTQWYFPEGTTSSGAPEDIDVYNPSQRVSTVKVRVHLDAGSASPFRLSVPAGSFADLSMVGEASIPAAVGETIAVNVVRGAPVVAVQTMATPAPPATTTLLQTTSNGGTASPWVTTVLGARRAATLWVLGGAPTPFSGHVRGTPGLLVAIQNPGRRPVTASISLLGSGSTDRGHASTVIHRVTIPAGSHALVQMTVGVTSVVSPESSEVAGTIPAVVVTSRSPVVAEEEWSEPGYPGNTGAAGVIGAR